MFDFMSWEKSYWRLVHIVFTVFYLEAHHHQFLEAYFHEEARHDFKQLKIVLDIVTSVMKSAQMNEIQI